MSGREATRVFVVDRVEGRGAKAIVVLVSDDDHEVELPRAVLGKLAAEGALLRVPLDGRSLDWSAAVRDRDAERQRIADAAETLKRLSATDPGGDLEL